MKVSDLTPQILADLRTQSRPRNRVGRRLSCWQHKLPRGLPLICFALVLALHPYPVLASRSTLGESSHPDSATKSTINASIITPTAQPIPKGGLARFVATFEGVVTAGDVAAGALQFKIVEADGLFEIDDPLLDSIQIVCGPTIARGVGANYRVDLLFRLHCTRACRLCGVDILSFVITNPATSDVECTHFTDDVFFIAACDPDDTVDWEVEIEDENGDNTGHSDVDCVPVAEIPTLSIGGVVALVALLALIGVIKNRRSKQGN